MRHWVNCAGAAGMAFVVGWKFGQQFQFDLLTGFALIVASAFAFNWSRRRNENPAQTPPL